jgi:fucose permease
MASFILMTPGQHLAWRLLQLAFFGAVNSLQFTVMNTVTLRDLDREFASSGNSLLSMVMMLAAGFGAAAAAACWPRSAPTWTATAPPLRCMPRSCAWARSR